MESISGDLDRESSFRRRSPRLTSNFESAMREAVEGLEGIFNLQSLLDGSPGTFFLPPFLKREGLDSQLREVEDILFSPAPRPDKGSEQLIWSVREEANEESALRASFNGIELEDEDEA